MNIIKKIPLQQLGYNFIIDKYLPNGKDEYYLRNIQNRYGIKYRQLNAFEIETLVRNDNTCDNWNNFLVSNSFNPDLVKNCKFYGLIRIGKLEPFFLEHSNLRVPVGLYNSTIVSCDFGDNVSISQVNYLSHYILGNDVIVANVNELSTTPHAKFGNGVVKEGEDESIRIVLELRNENGGRSIIPFNGMLPGDAWIWSTFRSEQKLLEKLTQFTQDKFDVKRGYYGKIGNRTVIKNCKMIKDVWVGSDAYFKGANKLKNLTIDSTDSAPSQIGEGCELVNGIVGIGCRIFYGVKAVRFILASHSQLKYGARLINSYLGNNATISCCEVLNSLIFPFHEQHHNNSFLCAALIMGQSNMAAGATVGSNHNSRSADGEIAAARGFWPGLCVSLKHNSRFASFTMLAKGDYPHELDIRFPFSLVSQVDHKNELHIRPAFWFMHNMYALARNSWKYEARDRREDKTQHLELDWMAPDTISEIEESLTLLEKYTGMAWYKAEKQTATEEKMIAKGHELLNTQPEVANQLEILAPGMENSRRIVRIIKPSKSYQSYRGILRLYSLRAVLNSVDEAGSLKNAQSQNSRKPTLKNFINVGGQLIPEKDLMSLKTKIENGKIKNWEQVHQFYSAQGRRYPLLKRQHGLAIFHKYAGMTIHDISAEMFAQLVQEFLSIHEELFQNIYASRAKDYDNQFRNMMYNSSVERDVVLGSLEDNSFIRLEKEKLQQLKKKWKKAL